MFLSLAQLFEAKSRPRGSVFEVHPLQLSRWLDEAWSATGLVPLIPGQANSAPFLGSATIVDTLDLPAATIKPSGIDDSDPDRWTGGSGPTRDASGLGLLWHHLVYAYLIESTGVLEVFAETMRRLVLGESLGALSPAGVRWMRATEELFFREPPLFSIHGVVSELRPHARLSRRNAYWRMFGLDLPHPIPSRWGPGNESGWKADIGLGVNADFRAKWTELLRQVWLGTENRKNSAGANATDPAYVALLCVALKDMMNNRRRGGLLAREEFAYVTALSWFHLTVQDNHPIVVDLKAEATSPADRLASIAQRVGMSPAARSRELFELAEPMSTLLRAIELGLFDTPTQAALLYDGTNPALARDMNNVIDLWQSATGERVKDRPTGNVAVSSPQPLRIPTPTPATTNGRA